MPRTLSKPPPSSSVARLLNAESVSRALQPLASASPPVGAASPSTSTATHRPPLVKREFVLNAAAATTLDAVVDRLRAGTGTRLNASHALRSLLLTLNPRLASLEALAASLRPWKLPPNGESHSGERAAFEQRLAEILRRSVQCD